VSSAGALGLLYKSDRYYLPPGRCVSKHSIRARRRLLTRERTVNAYPPLMLGYCPATRVWLIAWCKQCQHQVEPDPAEIAARCGAGAAVLDWRERLVCSRCGSRQVGMVVCCLAFWCSSMLAAGRYLAVNRKALL
jgi:hypothetical protein